MVLEQHDLSLPGVRFASPLATDSRPSGAQVVSFSLPREEKRPLTIFQKTLKPHPHTLKYHQLNEAPKHHVTTHPYRRSDVSEH